MTREEAIKIIDCYDIGFYDLSGEKIPAEKLVDAFDMAIKALEQTKWVPCSERLPEADVCPMDCMVTRESQYIGNYVDIAVCESDGTWTHEDWDAIVVGDVESGRKTGLISTRDDEIIAWMPLPEPYKGGEKWEFI